MSALDRILLIGTVLLAGYQVAVGIEGMRLLSMGAFFLGFGVLMVASLLLIILGYEATRSPWMVILSTLIPLSIALGLVAMVLPQLGPSTALAAIAGLAAVVATQLCNFYRPSTHTLTIVHGVSGIVISLLPFWMVLQGKASPGFGLVGIGGLLIGAGGVLLVSLRTGRPILAASRIYQLLPVLLLSTTACITLGMRFG